MLPASVLEFPRLVGGPWLRRSRVPRARLSISLTQTGKCFPVAPRPPLCWRSRSHLVVTLQRDQVVKCRPKGAEETEEDGSHHVMMLQAGR